MVTGTSALTLFTLFVIPVTYCLSTRTRRGTVKRYHGISRIPPSNNQKHSKKEEMR